MPPRRRRPALLSTRCGPSAEGRTRDASRPASSRRSWPSRRRGSDRGCVVSDRPGGVRRSLVHDSFDVSAYGPASLRAGVRHRRGASASRGCRPAREPRDHSAGNPEGDVLFGIDDNLLATALEHERLRPPTPSSRLDSARRRLRAGPPASRHAGRPRRGLRELRRRPIRGRGSPGPPQTLADLADPAYRDLSWSSRTPRHRRPGSRSCSPRSPVRRTGLGGVLEGSCVTTASSWSMDGRSAYFGEFSGAGGGEGHPTRSSCPMPRARWPRWCSRRSLRTRLLPALVNEASCFRQVELAGMTAGPRTRPRPAP